MVLSHMRTEDRGSTVLARRSVRSRFDPSAARVVWLLGRTLRRVNVSVYRVVRLDRLMARHSRPRNPLARVGLRPGAGNGVRATIENEGIPGAVKLGES